MQFSTGVGRSYLETREVCSDSTELDISYATFYEGHLPRFISFIILPNINKLMILADGERMLRVLHVVKSERM